MAWRYQRTQSCLNFSAGRSQRLAGDAGSGRPVERKGENGTQAWFVILKAKGSTVHLGDGRDEAEAQSGSRSGPADLEAHEALQNALAVGHGNTWSAIGDGDDGLAVQGDGGDGDGEPSRVGVGTLGRVLQRIVDQIGQGLTDKLPIGLDRNDEDAACSSRKPASSAAGA